MSLCVCLFSYSCCFQASVIPEVLSCVCGRAVLVGCFLYVYASYPIDLHCVEGICFFLTCFYVFVIMYFFIRECLRPVSHMAGRVSASRLHLKFPFLEKICPHVHKSTGIVHVKKWSFCHRLLTSRHSKPSWLSSVDHKRRYFVQVNDEFSHSWVFFSHVWVLLCVNDHL